MNRSILRRTSAAAATVLALGSLAACGSDDDPSADPSASESSESGEATTPSEDATEETEDPAPNTAPAGDEIDPSEFLDVYAQALDDATSAKVTITIQGSLPVSGSGVADYSTTPPSMQIVMNDTSTGQDQEMVMVDGILYIELSPDRFVKYDLDDPAGPLGAGFGDFLDPRSMVDLLEEGVTGATYVGEEDVDGESMEHYTVTLDPSALTSELELPSGAPTDAVPESLTFEIWVDEDGLLRRQLTGEAGSPGSVEQRFDDWGEPVTITAPPASQVTELPNVG